MTSFWVYIVVANTKVQDLKNKLNMILCTSYINLDKSNFTCFRVNIDITTCRKS